MSTFFWATLYKHLVHTAQKSATTPLAVIAQYTTHAFLNISKPAVSLARLAAGSSIGLTNT